MEGKAHRPKPLDELLRPTDGTELVPLRPDVGEAPWSHEESVDAIVRRGRQLYERAQVLSRAVLEEVAVKHDRP